MTTCFDIAVSSYLSRSIRYKLKHMCCMIHIYIHLYLFNHSLQQLNFLKPLLNFIECVKTSD
jgi:hypothetical protein